MDLVKILLECEEGDDITLESVWATPVGEYYKVENIPFYATSIAYGDLVSAEDRDGELFFDELIEASGHSVIQIIFYQEEDVEPITQDLVNLGCTWEGSHLPTYIAVDVPLGIDYKSVQIYLEEKTNTKKLGYREACLGFL
jgi:hypothetical protein